MSKPIVCSLFRFIIAVCFFAIAASAHAAEGKPVAVVETDTHNFGLAYEGKDVIHEFTLKNTGNADLEVKAVKTG